MKLNTCPFENKWIKLLDVGFVVMGSVSLCVLLGVLNKCMRSDYRVSGAHIWRIYILSSIATQNVKCMTIRHRPKCEILLSLVSNLILTILNMYLELFKIFRYEKLIINSNTI